MKEAIKTSRAAGQLEKIYRQLNVDKFGGELVTPIITIQNTPRAYGHVTVAKVWKVKDTDTYELNIDAGTINRPIENVVSTVLHEMVHIYHLQYGIQDCSRGGAYHNKKFRDKAESVGLVIEYDQRIGWSITSPSYDLIDYICAQGWQDISIGRKGSALSASGGDGSDTSTDRTRRPSSTRKYVCPNCGTTYRATRKIRAICGECYYDYNKIINMSVC